MNQKAKKKLAKVTHAAPTTKAEHLPAATPPEATEAPAKVKAPTKKELKYRAEWKIEGNRNALTRTVNRANLAKLLEKKLTWEEYCDCKAAAWAEYWEARKTNPTALKKLKKLTPVQAAKRREMLLKRQAQLAQLEAELAMGLEDDTEETTATETEETTDQVNEDTDTEDEDDE